METTKNNIILSEDTCVEEDVDIKKDEKKDRVWKVILWNDDVNTFDHVINTLQTVCQHSVEQAEQCAWIIHTKGKCDVKSGEKEKMISVKRLLCDAQLEATVEQ